MISIVANEAHPAKFVAPGTVIMRRSDVMGLLHKRIAQAHEEADDMGENGSFAAFSAVRHKIAAYMAVLSDLRAVPHFTNEVQAPLATSRSQHEGASS